jgi:lysophospholipase L1-like esterase
LGLTRRVLATAIGVPVVVAAVLGIEVEVARRGRNLDDVELQWEDGGATPVLWLGDSTAYGVGVTDGDDSVASLVARARGERVVNLAVSGATLHEVVTDQLPEVAALSPAPARVYVSIGANDVTHLTKTAAFEADYRKLLRRLPMEAELVVLGVPDMGAPPRLAQPLRAVAGWRGRHLDAVVQRVARRHPGATYVDVEGRTGPRFRRDPDRLFAADGYHPSPAGYRVWADAVLATVGSR